ncbi:hypothetical protein GFGA_1c1163 [Gluconobacter frateurii NBRC 103465]|nr:hypothetical protein GFGA_1c1163 [Gluconobacter frateurii NBRC 103465]
MIWATAAIMIIMKVAWVGPTIIIKVMAEAAKVTTWAMAAQATECDFRSPAQAGFSFTLKVSFFKNRNLSRTVQKIRSSLA